MRCSLLPEQRIFALKCLNLCLCLLKFFCERHRLLWLGMVRRRLRRRLLILQHRRRYPATVALLSQYCKSIDLKISWNNWAFPRYVSRCLSLTLDCHQYRIDATRPYMGRTSELCTKHHRHSTQRQADNWAHASAAGKCRWAAAVL